tara:strand:- start:41 stop:241 length:201 start_codon:yes stop_codon:yes gene_type:complete
MDTIDRIGIIDRLLMMSICSDVLNEKLYTEVDDETLELVLTGIWEDLESNGGFGEFAQYGVNVGEA